jgi:hypothetical protein
MSRHAIAAALAALVMSGCEAPEAQSYVLALWLPDDTAPTVQRIRELRESECQARLLTPGAERQFQEWRVQAERWQSCLDALGRVNALTSPVSMDWLYWTLGEVESVAGDDDAIARHRVRFPDYRALFTHLTGDGLSDVRTDGPLSRTYPLHGRRMFVRDVDGQLISGALEDLSLDAETGRYSLRFSLGTQGLGILTADAAGFTGYFVLGGLLYDIGVANGGMQLVSVRPVPPTASHPPEHSAGALFTSADAAALNATALRNYASYQGLELARNANVLMAPPLQCARSYPAPLPDSASVINVLFAYTEDADLQSAVVVDSLPKDQRKPIPRDWTEVGNHLTFEASKVFADHELVTRVRSLGAVKLAISEKYWREKAGKLVGDDDVLLFWHSAFLAQKTLPAAAGDKLVNSELGKVVDGDSKMKQGVESLRALLNETRFKEKADVVAIIASQSSELGGRFCGLSGAIRAQFGNSLIITRVDCAMLNLSFSHELGHLLGARHEGPPSYVCVPGSQLYNRGECAQDDEDYGTVANPLPDPVPRTNRAYIDLQKKTGTLMTSGASGTRPYETYLRSDLRLERMPLWSQIDPEVINGVNLSYERCCSDGAYADAYAAGCVSQFLPEISLPIKPTPPGFDGGTNDPKPVIDIRELEATMEFALNQPRSIDNLTAAQQLKLLRIDEQLLANNLKKFVVEGFADTTGSTENSARVSERRALAIAKRLCKDRPDRLVGYNSYGETGLIISTKDARLERRNRRALISWRPEGMTAYGISIKTQSCADFLNKDLVAFQDLEKTRLSAANTRR